MDESTQPQVPLALAPPITLTWGPLAVTADIGITAIFEKSLQSGETTVKLRMIQIPPQYQGTGIVRDFLALLLEEAWARRLKVEGEGELEAQIASLRGNEKIAEKQMAAPQHVALVPVWDEAAGVISAAGLDVHLDISTPRNGKVRIKGIHVDPALRGKGIGRSLARVALSQAEARRLSVTFDASILPLFESVRRERLANKSEENGGGLKSVEQQPTGEQRKQQTNIGAT